MYVKRFQAAEEIKFLDENGCAYEVSSRENHVVLSRAIKSDLYRVDSILPRDTNVRYRIEVTRPQVCQ